MELQKEIRTIQDAVRSGKDRQLLNEAKRDIEMLQAFIKEQKVVDKFKAFKKKNEGKK